MSEELVKVEPQAEPTPLSLIQSAIAAKWTGEQIRDLVDMARQAKRDAAAEAFAAAVTKFQSMCPQVKKTRTAQGSKFSFNFASLDDVMYAARPHLMECGLVVTFTSRPAPDGKGYEITCNVRHGIHVEPTTITLPAPSLSSMDAVQQFGSVVSYGKRYALCAALNIVVSDEDDDAANVFEKITEEQVAELEAMIAEKGVDRVLFLEWVSRMQPGIKELAEIANAIYPKVHHGLTMKKKAAPTPTVKGKK